MNGRDSTDIGSEDVCWLAFDLDAIRFELDFNLFGIHARDQGLIVW